MRWWDIAPVLELERELFPGDPWSKGMFWSELAETRHPGATRHYIVATTGAPATGPGGPVAGLLDPAAPLPPKGRERVIGYAGLMAIAGEGDIQTIAVATDQWGTGLGARLLSTLLRKATEFECRDVLLEVRVDNTRAQRLYERFGFTPVGIRRGYYQPDNVDALVMRLTGLDGPGAPGASSPTRPGKTSP